MHERDGRGERRIVHVLPTDSSAPGQARDTCEGVLRHWWGDAVGDLDLDAVLVVSELVTNAVEARAGEISLQLDALDGKLRIAVRDDAPGAPQRSDPGSFGRGLTIVDRLSVAWGIDGSTDGAGIEGGGIKGGRIDGGGIDGRRMDGGIDGDAAGDHLATSGPAGPAAKTVWAALELPAGLDD